MITILLFLTIAVSILCLPGFLALSYYGMIWKFVRVLWDTPSNRPVHKRCLSFVMLFVVIQAIYSFAAIVCLIDRKPKLVHDMNLSVQHAYNQIRSVSVVAA